MTRLPQVLLIPVDGSEGSDATVGFAAALATPLGMTMRLLFAFPEHALDVFGVPPETMDNRQLSAYSPEHFAEVRGRRADDVFARARSVIGQTTAQIEEAVLAGDPATAILAHAAKVDDAMIIMGSRGLSRVSELLVGSVSHRVLHHAKCPVTIVHR